MSGSQFSFLEVEFSDQFVLAEWAERHALSDPGPAVIHARKALESGVKWMFEHDRALPRPWEDKLNAYVNEPAFKDLANGLVYKAAKKIQRAGNAAVHESKEPTQLEAVEVISALFQFCFFLAFTYGRTTKPDPTVKFDPRALPRPGTSEQVSLKERQELEQRLADEAHNNARARQRVAELSNTVEELEAKHAALIEEVAAAKKAAAAAAVPIEAHDWSELETRRYKIDALLAEAGWMLTAGRDREFEVHGMPSGSGVGFVDYVLWGDDGLPLAIVEAKKTLTSPLTGQQQAKLYADCLEQMTGQRPVIFYSNGYEHWLWDDTRFAPRSVQGFLTKDELALLIQRRTSTVPLASLVIDDEIVERYYQRRAIQAISERFEIDKQRKSLLVMATGAGKTRTVIALVDLLMRAGLVKRVLFLADRTALVNQAVNAFKQHLPDSAPVNLVTEPNETGRVYLSTYQTMVGKIDQYRPDGTRRFGVGYFDLVVIDEAHRSVYRKYRGIFDYFDALLVGLTATPKDEVDKNTYDLFDLETGVPTGAYALDDAIDDGFLVPPRGVSIETKFLRSGIRYADLSEEERDVWDELEWGEDEDGNPLDPPEQVDAAALNKFLFNEDTVDKVLERVMTDGIKVAGGDRLGKTIIFAKNQRHADYIYERFVANYPHLDNGNFARVITHSVKYGQSLIDDFSIQDKAPHIAISVDMLDTGIDVPEVVNLVFFKLVRSKTKFWQMIGRGTRLCPNLFGPGEEPENHKTHFNVFDFCQNLEYFSQPLVPAEGSGGTPLSELIFQTRLELIQTFDSIHAHDDERAAVAQVLRTAIASMNPNNFLVRPHLELVERFRQDQPWDTLTVGDLAALADRVAKLPAELDSEHEDAKRFDVLLLNAQLGVLRGEPFERQRRKIMAIAGALEDQQAIPVIAAQLELIQDIQHDEWWLYVSYPMLEEVRKRLRLLVQLIERSRKGVLYSDFQDVIGETTSIDLPGTGGTSAGSTEFLQFRKKAEHFLKDHLADDVVAKVRSGAPLTDADLAELQRILVAAGIGDDATFAAASSKAGSFGRFVRSLVGLDRNAAKLAFADFLDDKRYSKNQIEFVNLIINELTERGLVEAARVYETPYDGLAPQGPEAIFVEADLDKLFATLDDLTASAG
ncbi:DEAD/DEAH box helicase family protein [Aquihabitans sp. G128]|uniref:DEAD/DEAH box helicase family protein n=1 Tax=Aquihabitans sp. G128 TaxID=2849779 RepID=UPI001C2145BF|nr:DEAD/DEAH box helicase family protein [Aquihabitans sp. G128]QXC60784.1 DEAD/DEAH box helicase family protein [Aquihabitans sp. G128]